MIKHLFVLCPPPPPRCRSSWTMFLMPFLFHSISPLFQFCNSLFCCVLRVSSFVGCWGARGGGGEGNAVYGIHHSSQPAPSKSLPLMPVSYYFIPLSQSCTPSSLTLELGVDRGEGTALAINILVGRHDGPGVGVGVGVVGMAGGFAGGEPNFMERKQVAWSKSCISQNSATLRTPEYKRN